MSLKPEFFHYIRRLGRTAPVRALLGDQRNIVALRHDVDYDLDLALEMAYWENQHGCRSTYYVLHTAPYWQDPQLTEKCLQIQDFGHEVGLHVNIIAEWFENTVDDVEQRLRDLLQPFQATGVAVTGTAAHGDRLCYQHRFINYWCFSNLRPDDPTAREDCRNAEGLVEADKQWQIRYPLDHTLVRPDGARLPLWRVNMNAHGLQYSASHLEVDGYFSDSGGSWKRTPDPLQSDLSQGRHQVLMHPSYWRGPQRVYFFLSTARSGSKWLSEVLDQATSVTARHEFSLNHRLCDGELVAEKRTGLGFNDLLADENEARELLTEIRSWRLDCVDDYAEANVYLPHFAKLLHELYPDASFVHLHREPSEVVRSIVNRGWYDTPEDTAHPIMPNPDWDHLDPFAKACCYVDGVNKILASACTHRLPFGRMVAHMDFLASTLNRIEIAFYPRLARPIFDKVVNSNHSDSFPAYKWWSREQKSVFHLLCRETIEDLGYQRTFEFGYRFRLGLWLQAGARILDLLRRSNKTSPNTERVRIADVNFKSGSPTSLYAKRCTIEPTSGGLTITPSQDEEGHSHVLLAGAHWHLLRTNAGWPVENGHYFRGTLTADLRSGDSPRVFSLFHGGDGKLLKKKLLGSLDGGDDAALQFAFAPDSWSARFNIAIHFDATAKPAVIELKALQLEKVPSVHLRLEEQA